MTGSPRARLAPQQRREQLLDLGARLLATRSLDELSIDLLAEEAGVSRGLLYHYFGSKQAFHEAVVRHAAEQLLARTATPTDAAPRERLRAGIAAYVDYVVANHEGYLSLVRAAAGGGGALREVYEETRAAITARVLDQSAGLVDDTPAARLLVRGWAALAEEVVLQWIADPADLARPALVDLLADALRALLSRTP